MGANKRRGEPAVPPDLATLLNKDQRIALKQLESFGWAVHLVRRPKFEPLEIILEHSSGKLATLTEAGELAHKPQPNLRHEPIPEYAGDEGADPWANLTDNAEPREMEHPNSATTINKEPVPRPAESGTKPGKKILV